MKIKVGQWVEQTEGLNNELALCKITQIGGYGADKYSNVYHIHLRATNESIGIPYYFNPISRAKAILKYGFDIEQEEYI